MNERYQNIDHKTLTKIKEASQEDVNDTLDALTREWFGTGDNHKIIRLVGILVADHTRIQDIDAALNPEEAIDPDSAI